MIKKLLPLVLLLVVAADASAYDFTANGLCYDFIPFSDNVVLTYQSEDNDYNYKNLSGKLVIPKTVKHNGKSYSVAKIGKRAFDDCDKLTSVKIPSSVTGIDESAFASCDELTSVSIPKSVTTIGEYAFSFCDNLKSVKLPNSLAAIGDAAFMGCTSLTSIVIPASVTSIDSFVFNGCGNLASIKVEKSNPKYDSRDNCNAIIETASNTLIAGCQKTIIPNSVNKIKDFAFKDCTGLASITIPTSVTEIGSSAFEGCTGLASITIPNSVTKIGTSAFGDCKGLTSLTISNSVTEIGMSVFSGCTGLASITIPTSVTEIGWSAFSGCTGLTSITIPNSVNKIEDSAFRGCTGLTSITIPNSVNKIEDCAFNGCTGLASVTIPNSVTEIGSGAFEGCTGLKSVELGNSVTEIGDLTFSNCTALTTINLPSSVTKIGIWAFRGCSSLTSITIPASVAEIGDKAFEGCAGLNSIVSLINAPQHTKSDINVFKGVDKKNCKLYVPAGTLHAYESVSTWKYFANKEERGGTAETTTVLTQIAETPQQRFDNCYKAKRYSNAITAGEHLLSNSEFTSDPIMVEHLADCYYFTGNYSKAKEFYEKAANFYIGKDSENSIAFAYLQERIGQCNFAASDYSSAEKNFSKTILCFSNIKNVSGNEKSQLQLLAKCDLYICYVAQGKFDEAAETYLSVTRSNSGDLLFGFRINDLDNQAIRIILNRGDDFCNHNQIDKAINLYSTALTFFEKTKGEKCFEISVMYEKIGRCLFLQDKMEEAMVFFSRCESIINQTSGHNFDDIVRSCNIGLRLPSVSTSQLRNFNSLIDELSIDYGIWHAATGDFSKSYVYLHRALDNIHKQSVRTLGNSTSSERAEFWKKYSFLFNDIYPSVVDIAHNEKWWKTPGATVFYGDLYGDLYDKSALFAKGLLLCADNEFGRVIYESGNSILIERFEEMRAMAAHRDRLLPEQEKELEARRSALEKEVLEISRDYGNFMDNLQLDWKQVRDRLGEGDIAVEFLRVPAIGSDSTFYVALTVRKGYDSPHMIELCEERDLKRAAQNAYAGTELSDMIWGQLARNMEYEQLLKGFHLVDTKKSELDGVENIYFSPAGELHRIAIESVPKWDAPDKLMSEGYNIYRLSSTRELVLKRDDYASSGAAIYGGIFYQTPVDSMGAPRKDGGRGLGDKRGFDAGDTGRRGTTWKFLPGTMHEAEAVDSILSGHHTEVSLMKEMAATETSFKDLSMQKKSIIHIATHGFYWNDSTAREMRLKHGIGFLAQGYDGKTGAENAMTRTGLLFSGAQHVFNDGDNEEDRIPEGVDDGVLTAREVADLDLRGLDLLVLSACQTGLGEISSEGVFGLQRGFKMAGAQAMVMSLWKVDDKATGEMMVEFYSGLAEGMSTHRAFVEAQKKLREKYGNFKDAEHTQPTGAPHWAAFIILDAADKLTTPQEPR